MGRVWRPEEDEEEEKTVGEKRGGEKSSGSKVSPTQGEGRSGVSGVPGTLRSLTISGRIGLAGCVLGGGEAVGEKRQSSEVSWEQHWAEGSVGQNWGPGTYWASSPSSRRR